jgi:hypothetical protein
VIFQNRIYSSFDINVMIMSWNLHIAGPIVASSGWLRHALITVHRLNFDNVNHAGLRNVIIASWLSAALYTNNDCKMRFTFNKNRTRINFEPSVIFIKTKILILSIEDCKYENKLSL